MKRFRWWHGLVFYAGIQMLQRTIRSATRDVMDGPERRTLREDLSSYEDMRLPIFAPPGVAFPIAWSINVASLIAGDLYVLNLPVETEGRKEYLTYQAVGWGLFALFETAYFELRSPINAAFLTFAYSGATVASLAIAQGKMKNRYAILSLATTLAWLALANPVGIAHAAWNHDPFWNAGPFLEPPRGWEKKQDA